MIYALDVQIRELRVLSVQRIELNKSEPEIA